MAIPNNVTFSSVNRAQYVESVINGGEVAGFELANLVSTDLGLRWRAQNAGYSAFEWFSNIAIDVPFPVQILSLNAHNLHENALVRIQVDAGGGGFSDVESQAPTAVESYSNITDDADGDPPLPSDVDNNPHFNQGSPDYSKATGTGNIRWSFGSFTGKVNIPNNSDLTCGVVVAVQYETASTHEVLVSLWEAGLEIRKLGVMKNNFEATTTHRQAFFFASDELVDPDLDDVEIRLDFVDGVWVNGVEVFAMIEAGGADVNSGVVNVFDTFSEIQEGSPTLADISGDGINWLLNHIFDTEIADVTSIQVDIFNPAYKNGISTTHAGFPYFYGSISQAEAGYLHIGTLLTPPENYAYGTTFGVEDKSTVTEMDDGGTLVDRNRRKRVAAITLDNQDPVFALQNFHLWMDLNLGQSKPFIFIPDPTTVGVQTIRNMMARFDGINPFSIPYFDVVKQQMKITEW